MVSLATGTGPRRVLPAMWAKRTAKDTRCGRRATQAAGIDEAVAEGEHLLPRRQSHLSDNMVASAVFVLDQKGKIIISRNYRGDIPMSAAEKFVTRLQEGMHAREEPPGTRGHRCAAVAGCARRACAPRPRSALSFPPTADRCRLGASRVSWAAVRAGRGRRWACDERLFFSPRRHPVSWPRAAPRCPDLDTFRSLFCAMRCNFPCARVLCAQCACLFPRDCTAAAFRRSANADEPLLRPPRACR